MLDQDQIDLLRAALIDRFTAEELCEILSIDTGTLIDRFIEETLRIDWDDHL